MICLRSGFCCIHLNVIIVDDPKLGIIEGNAIAKPSGQKCQHLLGNLPGQHSCAVHNYPWCELPRPKDRGFCWM